MEKQEFKIKNVLYIFIALHVILFSCVALFRAILPIDAMESIQWGALLDFGTSKHPPLAAWICYFIYNLFHRIDFSIYLLGQLFIAIGFIYIYKCAKLFLDETKAILATLITGSCFVYSYITPYEGFDPNFILLSFLPIVVYYFYKAVKFNKTIDWILLGIYAGLCALGKYQSTMVFIPLFLYLIIENNARKNFKNPKLYLSAAIAFLIFLPHLIWLFKNDFFSFQYFIYSEELYSDFIQSNLKYIISPLKFLFEQLGAIFSALFIFFSSKLIFNKPLSFKKGDYPDNLFLLLTGIAPIILQALPGFLNGAELMSTWGYELLFMTGIMLFYFIPYELNKKAVNYIIFFVFLTMSSIFIALSIIFATEKGETNRIPIEEVDSKLKADFQNETGKALKYLRGYDRYTIILTPLNSGLIGEIRCWGHENPWISKKEMDKEGYIIIDEGEDGLIDIIERDFPELNLENMQIKALKYDAKSFVGRKREHTLYYTVVKPEKLSSTLH